MVSSMNNRKNFISALILQTIAILQGLILPRLMISTFGSEINGLVSSITQFLSFISLLEGGLGAVVLAELYSPLEKNDTFKTRDILSACQVFFNKLAISFIIFTCVLSVCYPLLTNSKLSYPFVCSLIWILSISTLAQYLFSITNKLLLQSDQKIYIVNIISSIIIFINLILAIIVIYVYPQIHIMKLVSSAIYLIQPIAFSFAVDKKYKIKHRVLRYSGNALKNRWSGFAQNLAHFINMNTDIALITIFVGLKDVSVYTVYLLAINALRNLITNVANSYQGALGKYNAEGNIEKLKAKFNQFETSFLCISLILFLTCLLLINPFVQLYTKNVTDVNYYRPNFALIIVLANLVYCIREPFRILILALGKFKETNFGSMMEAILNFLISIILLPKFGLLGVAIGTLCAISYRLLYFIQFLKRDVFQRPYRSYFKNSVLTLFIIVVNILCYYMIDLHIYSFGWFVLYGFVVIIIESLIVISLLLGWKNVLSRAGSIFIRE